MFYKIRNLLLFLISAFAALNAVQAKAQGVVSLSEEAMFDDELETNNDFPELEMPKKAEEAPVLPDDTAKTETAAAQTVAPSAPASAPAPIPAPREVNLTNSATQAKQAAVQANPLFGNSRDEIQPVTAVSGDLFQQMSDIEKRTALLNLELKRERLQNEIEAVKNQRQQAIEQEKEKAEQQRLKSLEFEKEQERKVLQEQEKLRELDIKFETLRQEKLLGAYKNKMLEENQKWIEHNAAFYRQIADLRKSKRDLTEATKKKLEDIKKEALNAREAHETKIKFFQREIKDQQAQIGVLRNRIETMEAEREEMRRNPFADPETAKAIAAAGFSQGTPGTVAADPALGSNSSSVEEPVETDFSKLYAVTEIRGQGGELIAKMVNKNGTAFYVKKGTVLQTGHTVGDITLTYVSAERGGEKKYLYLAAGGVLPTESQNAETAKTKEKDDEKSSSSKTPSK